MTTPRATDAEALTELERLLVARLTDAMKDPAPKASAMAVAERFLASRKGKTPPPSPKMDPRDVPFPKQLEPDWPAPRAEALPKEQSAAVPFPRSGSVPFPKAPDVPTMAEALQKPFAADGDPSQT